MGCGRTFLGSLSCTALPKESRIRTTTATGEDAGEDAGDGAGGDSHIYHHHPLHLPFLLRLSKAVGGEVGWGPLVTRIFF